MQTDLQQLENRLWKAVYNLRANSSLSSFEYSTPVLGLIFLRYAWHRFKPLHEKMEKETSSRVKLKSTRDLLLPEFISGKIDVEEVTV